MKKRAISLSLVLLIWMSLEIAAWADNGDYREAGLYLYDYNQGNFLTVQFTPAGKDGDGEGWHYDAASNTLTLDNFNKPNLFFSVAGKNGAAAAEPTMILTDGSTNIMHDVGTVGKITGNATLRLTAVSSGLKLWLDGCTVFADVSSYDASVTGIMLENGAVLTLSAPAPGYHECEWGRNLLFGFGAEKNYSDVYIEDGALVFQFSEGDPACWWFASAGRLEEDLMVFQYQVTDEAGTALFQRIEEPGDKGNLGSVDGPVILLDSASDSKYVPSSYYKYCYVYADGNPSDVVIFSNGNYTLPDSAFAPNTTQPINATPTASTVLVNGEAVRFDAYNIDGSNYFKLRDLAYVLNGTQKQFAVEWDSSANAISLISGQPYEPVGGEMTAGSGETQSPSRTTSKILLNGAAVSMDAYNIGGNNYFKLRDVGVALNFGVDWDAGANTVIINTSKGYTPVV